VPFQPRIEWANWPPVGSMAEADGNRTRLIELLDHVGVEDRGGHQAPIRLHRGS